MNRVPPVPRPPLPRSPPHLPSSPAAVLLLSFSPLHLMFNLNSQRCGVNVPVAAPQHPHMAAKDQGSPEPTPPAPHPSHPPVAQAWKKKKNETSVFAEEPRFSCSQRGFAMFSQGLKVVIT